MLHSKLIKIQNELKAPKSQYNSFGKYKYRSCEDILEAAKPLLREYQVSLTINDDLVMIGDRFYIKSIVTLTDTEDKEVITVNAFAREEENKKGMDGSQVTGASSSYARKYALNGLFLIDDTKDSNCTNTHEPKKEKPKMTADEFIEEMSKCTTLYEFNKTKINMTKYYGRFTVEEKEKVNKACYEKKQSLEVKI